MWRCGCRLRPNGPCPQRNASEDRDVARALVGGHDLRLIVNNDSGEFYVFDEPMDIEHLYHQVDMLVGTGVDTLAWNIGVPGAYRYDTKVSTRWGHEMPQWSQARWCRVQENLDSFIRRGIDPLRVILDRGKEKGIKVYPSVRIYDCQMGGDLDPMNRAHPEWQIGAYPRFGPASDFNADTYLRQLDNAQPAVRERTVSVAGELLDRYQVEGLELDFERRPHFFKPDEAIDNRHLMTDMVRRIRTNANRASKALGKPIEVMARVWMNMSDCWSLGLDVEAWVKEGLIDTLIPANHYHFALDHPIEEYAQLVADTSVQLLISHCPCIGQTPAGSNPELPGSWRLPPAAGRPVLSDIPYNINNDMWHAGAQVAYDKGADGIETFNFSWIARCGDQWDHSILSELHDPHLVARHDKFYPYITPESVNKIGQLTDEPLAYSLYMADDPNAALQLLLKVYITQTTTRDQIAFRLNGKTLAMKRRLTCPDRSGGLQAPEVDPHHYFEGDLSDGSMVHGSNELLVELVERHPRVSAPLHVVGVNIEVRYAKIRR